MMIHKIHSSVDYNYWLKRLDTQLNKSSNRNALKLVKPKNKKTLLKTLGTSVINNPVFPLSMAYYTDSTQICKHVPSYNDTKTLGTFYDLD